MPLGEKISCEIFESSRARNPRIRLSREGDLSVVVPAGFRKDLVPSLLEAKKNWICRNLARIRAGMSPKTGEEACGCPNRVDLQAFGETWEVLYDQKGAHGGRLVEDEKSRALTLAGCGEEWDAAVPLRKWLVRRSRIFLESKLQDFSARHGMPYKRLAVRLQRTRWGSCSAQGNISLNAKLSFLHESLVDYVLWHELCHTVHMNHSRAFWDLLERKCPGSLVLRKALQKQQDRVPGWVEPGNRGMRVASTSERLTINLL